MTVGIHNAGMGNHLKAWRKFRRMTQEELALEVGTTKAVISNLETGSRPLSAKWLDKLAPVLNTTAGYILDHDPEDLDEAFIERVRSVPKEHRAAVLAVIETLRKAG